MRKFQILFLTALLLAACKSPPPQVVEESVIEVKEPEFEIISIAIIQADLVNTQFEAVLEINNPNQFAVDLSSLSYQLYGNGKFWADGMGSDILHVPAQSSCKTEFYFSMNFINMNRRLLDDVIAMREVRYRFEGNVEVEPGILSLSSFQMSFQRSGFSEVKKKTGKKPQAEKVYTSTFQPFSSHHEMDNW